jgi:hypothetical protein
VKVLIYSPGQDTGGQGARIKELLERHVPGLEVHSAIWTTTYIGYPTDIVLRDAADARRWLRWSDVLHMRHSLRHWCALGGPRPAVLHHHGRRFISGHEWRSAEAVEYGIRQVVSGLEMQALEPVCEWLPQPHDLDALARWRDPRPGTVRIVQCPTRASKGADLVRAAVRELAERYDVTFERVEGVAWEESLRRKGGADIFVDQVGPGAYGYGNNAVEAWAMGIPVVSEAPDPAVRERMVAAWGELPFLAPTPDVPLVRVLEELIRSAALREEWAGRGHAHARRYHDYPAVAGQLAALYGT